MLKVLLLFVVEMNVVTPLARQDKAKLIFWRLDEQWLVLNTLQFLMMLLASSVNDAPKYGITYDRN
jgi:hypothetical protein